MTQTRSLTEIWEKVLNDLEEASANQYSSSPSLTHQQRAWLKLVKPLQVTNGFALLAAPNLFAKEAIERNLEEPITKALEKFLGESITLAVKVVEPEPDPEEENDSRSLLRTALKKDPTTGPWPRPPMVPSDQMLEEEIPPFNPESVASDVQRRHFTDFANDPELVVEPKSPDVPPQNPAFSPEAQPQAPDLSSAPISSNAKNLTPEPTLNSRYTFDNYVVGPSNRFAAAAAWAISEAPAHAYNPLFIWGGSGLGKTHLLHAIGHYTRQLYPNLKVRYISTEEFTNDFINSLRDDRKEKFKRRYREPDLLLVDDIQFLEGKEGIQEEFFYTFEALHNANKQIVISSDRPPGMLATLEERLRTRFEWGLITDIQAPDLETRTAILHKKAQVDQLYVPDEVLELIASRIDRNIRELEGALIRVTAFASLNRQELTPDLARVVLRDLVPEDNPVDVTASDIMSTVAEFYKTTVDELCGPSKKRKLANARQVAMYLCRELTEMSLPKIGATFGGRDHTTVIYAEKKISKNIKNDRDLFTEVQQLTTEIKRRASEQI